MSEERRTVIYAVSYTDDYLGIQWHSRARSRSAAIQTFLKSDLGNMGKYFVNGSEDFNAAWKEAKKDGYKTIRIKLQWS